MSAKKVHFRFYTDTVICGQYTSCKTSNSCGGDFEDDSFLGIVLMIKAVRTSETSVYFNEVSRSYITESIRRLTTKFSHQKAS
jgi:hypothetical protein